MATTYTRADVLAIIQGLLHDQFMRLDVLRISAEHNFNVIRELQHKLSEHDLKQAEPVTGNGVVPASELTTSILSLLDTLHPITSDVEMEKARLLSQADHHFKEVQAQYNSGLITMIEYLNANSFGRVIEEQSAYHLRVYDKAKEIKANAPQSTNP